MYKIYIITNTVNRKKYVGKTITSLSNRLTKHFNDAKTLNTHFSRAIRKYGRDKFQIQLLCRCKTNEHANYLECYYINRFKTFSRGYNSTRGGDGGDTLSKHPDIDEIRRKISVKKQGCLNPNSRAVNVIDDSGQIILEFDTIKQCQDFFGIEHHTTITRRCRKVIKKKIGKT